MTARTRRPAVTPHPFQPDELGDCWCPLPADNACHAMPEVDNSVRDRILGEREEEA